MAAGQGTMANGGEGGGGGGSGGPGPSPASASGPGPPPAPPPLPPPPQASASEVGPPPSSSSSSSSSFFFGLGLPAHLTLSYPTGGAASASAAASSTCPPSSSSSSASPQPGRSLEKVLEEAASSGLLCLSARKLRDFPASASGAACDLSDTVQADLSKNRFTEIPPEVWQFAPLETLNLYHNCIKSIPEAIKNLQMLTYLNISRNLLSTLPKYLFDLPLKVLVVSNNKLVSIPEEIGKLRDLMELDISCNEIQVLPQQIGKLQSLKELNLRRNSLHILPDELGDLPLVKLDFSCNKITEIPVCYRKLRHLQVMILDNNPMQMPPAQICLKGKVHIFKFLSIQACLRMDKKPDSLDLPSLGKRIPSQPLTDSIEDFYPNKNHGPDSGIGSDNGDKRLSTTEPSDDDTISLHSQVSESTREQTHRNDNQLIGNKPELHKDPDVCDYLDPSSEDVASCDQGELPSGPSISYIKDRGKQAEKSPKTESGEDWGDEKRVQKEEVLVEEDDELKEVTDLRKIAAQLLQQEQKNRRRPLSYRTSFSEKLFQRTRVAGRASRLLNHTSSSSTRNRPKQMVESEKSLSADEANSPSSPYGWQYKSSRKSSSGNENDEEYDRADGPFGLKPRSAFARSRQDYSTVDPGFTMRRKMEHLREEREQIKQLRHNLESRLKVSLPDDIGAALMDGVVLCHLANHIRPRSVASIHVPSPAVPKLSMAKCRRNVENFLDACKKLGVPQDRLCLPHHILEERGLVKVGLTVQALLEIPSSKASQLSCL
ncbi:leucine-rich repeat and calponin homology domain-containing protein 2 isoform X6 [Anolis sagrei]|uniref:leucine-rich repeat and calponin homology domain-containing protein 2 isoform X6 n=1 Tax=Anolis sagrei TaxID=38937 RepID=UPI0035216BD2